MDRASEKTYGVATQAAKSTPATQAIAPGATRVRFRERQVLRAADLVAEQSYLVAVRRRHNIAQHGWGIVRGLELADTPDGLVVNTGVAVDGYGRELIVSSPLAIPADAFNELGSDAIDVWLFYELMEVSVRQRGVWDCGPGRNTRVREQSSLRLTAALEIDPRFPVEVLTEDLPFPSSKSTPDDPAREWPVYLGTIKPVAPQFDPQSPRPDATLKGEVVNTPSGRARLQVGSELESDTRRFAVSVADPSGKLIERLAVDREGNTIVTGNTAISSHTHKTTNETATAEEIASRLRLCKNVPPASEKTTPSTEPLCGSSAAKTGEPPGAARMINFLPLRAEPAVAAPWQIYRTTIKQEKRTLRQLRIELGHPGDKGDPKLSKLIVATRAGDDFTPCLTVSADCTVTIAGKLYVRGQLLKGRVQADVSDPRFAAEVANQWNAGTIVAETKVDTLFSGINSGDLSVVIFLRGQRGSEPPRELHGTLEPDEVLLYSMLVTNHSAATIKGIQLYVNVAFRGANVDEKVPAVPFDLGADQEIGIPGTPFDPDSRVGVIEISVVAVGVGPLPNVVGAAASLLLPVEEPAAPPPISTGTIRGTVLDTNGGVVSGARVDFKDETTLTSKGVTTSEDGSFVVSLASGRYTITVGAPGFTTLVRTNVALAPDQPLTLTLSPSAP